MVDLEVEVVDVVCVEYEWVVEYDYVVGVDCVFVEVVGFEGVVFGFGDVFFDECFCGEG